MALDKQLAIKLAKATKLIQNPVKNATNPFLKNKYADLGTVIDCIKQVLLDLNIVFIQHCRERDCILDVQTIFVDCDTGQTYTVNCSVHLKDISPQGSMGAFTYGRRYGLKAAFGLADEDDDANGASGRGDEVKPDKIVEKTPEQAGNSIKSSIFGKKS